jgi:hypothetical protein
MLFREGTLVRLNNEKAQFPYFSPAYWTLNSAIMELRTNHIGAHVFVFITNRYFFIQNYPWCHTHSIKILEYWQHAIFVTRHRHVLRSHGRMLQFAAKKIKQCSLL